MVSNRWLEVLEMEAPRINAEEVRELEQVKLSSCQTPVNSSESIYESGRTSPSLGRGPACRPRSAVKMLTPRGTEPVASSP